MNHYTHLTIIERETIFKFKALGYSIRKIAHQLHHSPSTISRELKRNKADYSPNMAQMTYQKRRKNSGRKPLLSFPAVWEKVRYLFTQLQWSPEEISQRLKFEKSSISISYNTIYRGIYAGIFEIEKLSRGNRGLIRKLRHRGKTRRNKGTIETRGKIRISHSIHQRPEEAQNRLEIGHWEADTVLGKAHRSCLVTMTDRKSRFLLAGKVTQKNAQLVKDEIIRLVYTIGLNKAKTITPDRGNEFAKHAEITEELKGVQFYFPDPHAPWQRGTNENTNGLLREYFPKFKEMDSVSDEQVEE